MNHLLNLGVLTVAILSVMSSPQIDAAIYKWKDAQGQMHYSATAPNGVEKENIQKKINQVSSLPSVPEGSTTSSKDTVDDNTETTESETDSNNSEYCKQQKNIVVALEKNAYVKWKIDDKETLLEGEAKAAKVKEIKQDIEKYCTSSTQ